MKAIKILCALDFSACSRTALRRAAAVARDAGAPLLLMHAVGPLEGLRSLASLDDPAVAHADGMLREYRHEALGAGVSSTSCVLASGAPAEAIVRAAVDNGCDLIVLGTHGRTGLSHAVLGSVAEKVVRHAPCDVLVVRRTGAPAGGQPTL